MNEHEQTFAILIGANPSFCSSKDSKVPTIKSHTSFSVAVRKTRGTQYWGKKTDPASHDNNKKGSLHESALAAHMVYIKSTLASTSCFLSNSDNVDSSTFLFFSVNNRFLPNNPDPLKSLEPKEGSMTELGLDSQFIAKTYLY